MVNSANNSVNGLRNMLAQASISGEEGSNAAAASSSADSDKKMRSDSTTSNTSAADGDGGDAAVAQKKPMFRSTKNQFGKVEFALQNRNNGETLCELEGVVIRPGTHSLT